MNPAQNCIVDQLELNKEMLHDLFDGLVPEDLAERPDSFGCIYHIPDWSILAFCQDDPATIEDVDGHGVQTSQPVELLKVPHLVGQFILQSRDEELLGT
jgi:hypothetical protein